MAFADHMHWSFQYDGRSQRPHFCKQLMDVLRREERARDGDRYAILPNYWKGYKRAEGGDLAIGEAAIDRRRDASGNWRYDVRVSNSTSGENLRFDFCCADDGFRTLSGPWRVRAINGAGDGYRAFTCEGRMTDRQRVALVVNGVTLPVGRFDLWQAATCNWALFDLIPHLSHRLKASGERVSLGILEDLEKVRAPAYIGFLEDWGVPLGDGALELSGFFVYGTGMLPSYWWLDQQERVVIASTTFQTFVLEGGAA